MNRVAFLALALCAAGCSCDWRLERMLSQPRITAYDDDPLRIELMEASSPPTRAVPWQSPVGPPELTEGCAGGDYARQIPIPLDEQVLRSGREHFATFCATCHGPLAAGESVVAATMKEAKPSSLIREPVRDYPPGRVYRTIWLGYKFMPSYRNELGVRERWAAVAHLQRLQSRMARAPTDAGVSAPVRSGPQCQGETP